MSSGIKEMWEDANHYHALAVRFKEDIKCRGLWPYSMDMNHYEELRERARKEKT
jgi:hypothetical protein